VALEKERKVNESPVVADLSTLRQYGHVLNKIIDGWPVVATASLPAGAPSLDGLVLIENAGGTRNLVFYAGGNRYRVAGSSF